MLSQTFLSLVDISTSVRIMIFQDIQVYFNAIVRYWLSSKQCVQVGPLLQNSLIVTILATCYYAKEAVYRLQAITHILLLKLLFIILYK